MAKRMCSVPGCDRDDRLTRGWCSMHYMRWRAHGTTDLPERPLPDPICSIDGCGKAVAARGWCPMHWYRWRKYGSTDLPERAPLPEICVVDACESRAGVPGSARGMCQKHYARWYKHGDASITLITVGNPAVCRTEGCSQKHLAKGLCANHYAQLRESERPVCTVSDCTKREKAKGLCANHYGYRRKHGVDTPEFQCVSCAETFPGSRNTIYCEGCRPSPHIYAARRRERLEENNAGLTEQDFAASREYRDIILNDPCVYCGAPATTVDHIQSVVHGGSDRWDNLAPACKRCNSIKRHRTLLAVLVASGRQREPRSPDEDAEP